MCELSIVFRGSLRAHTLSCLPHLDFSLTPSRVDLRVRESRVVLSTLGGQGGGKWYGLIHDAFADSLRWVACFVAACFGLLLSGALIVSCCTLMVLCSRWMHMRTQQLQVA